MRHTEKFGLLRCNTHGATRPSASPRLSHPPPRRNDAIEEERRLFYVAVTRARDELYLTYPHMRLNAGYGEMMQRPSRFLGEIPKASIEEWQIRGAF